MCHLHYVYLELDEKYHQAMFQSGAQKVSTSTQVVESNWVQLPKPCNLKGNLK